MPTTIQGYHLFQLGLTGQCAVKEYDEAIGVTKFRNELSDGYRSQVLFGSENGVRMFRLSMPTLTGGSLSSRTVTGPNGETLTYEDYIWSLYLENQITGTPFAIQSQRNNQYYLVDFVNEQLSYSRLLTKLYSTGVELKQVRALGVTVFDTGEVTGIRADWDGDTALSGGAWADDDNAFESLTVTGDVVDAASVVNGHTVKRFSNTTNDGRLSNANGGQSVYDTFIVMKMREATFSNNAGIFTDTSSGTCLVGTSGGTKFQNPGFTNFTYRKNGIAYASTDMQAPMNVWGVVHMHVVEQAPAEAGYIPINGLQFGKDRTVAGTFAEVDIARIILFTSLLPRYIQREITEHLIVKYAINS